MAETDASSKSDNSSSKSGGTESQSRASEARDNISDSSKDALSGKPDSSNKNEAPSAKDLADGQQRMEDTGKEAKAQFDAKMARNAPEQGTTAGADPASTTGTTPAETRPDIPKDVSMCMHDVAAEKVTCVKNGTTFDVPFDGWAPNATEQSMVETMAIAEHHPEFRTAEHMTRLSNGADYKAGIRDEELRTAATSARETVAGRSKWENIAAISGGVASIQALARVRGMRRGAAPTQTAPVDPVTRLRPDMGNFTPSHVPSKGAAIDPRLPDRGPKDPTHGVVDTPNGPIYFKSGATGPGAEFLPAPPTPALNHSGSHVEGHVAAMMRRNGVTELTVTINKAKGPCGTCRGSSPSSVSNILPKDSKLTVRWMNSDDEIKVHTIVGIGQQ